MFDLPHLNQDPGPEDFTFERRMHEMAAAFPFPPAPNLAARESLRVSQQPARPLPAARRRVFGAGLLVVLLLLVVFFTLAAPVRARVLNWLRLGAVKIFIIEPIPTATVPGTLSPILPTATVLPPGWLLDLSGETSLDAAAAQVPFPLRLPFYPPDLGLPQHLFLQQINQTSMVVMVWTDPADPQEVRHALFQVGKGEGDIFQKRYLTNFEETLVNGQWALWVEGPYLLVNSSGQEEVRRMVAGRTLIWMEGDVTYRLETASSLDEARKIAKSLKP